MMMLINMTTYWFSMRDIVDLIRAEDPSVYIKNIMIGKKANIFFLFFNSVYQTEEEHLVSNMQEVCHEQDRDTCRTKQ